VAVWRVSLRSRNGGASLTRALSPREPSWPSMIKQKLHLLTKLSVRGCAASKRVYPRFIVTSFRMKRSTPRRVLQRLSRQSRESFLSSSSSPNSFRNSTGVFRRVWIRAFRRLGSPRVPCRAEMDNLPFRHLTRSCHSDSVSRAFSYIPSLCSLAENAHYQDVPRNEFLVTYLLGLPTNTASTEITGYARANVCDGWTKRDSADLQTGKENRRFAAAGEQICDRIGSPLDMRRRRAIKRVIRSDIWTYSYVNIFSRLAAGQLDWPRYRLRPAYLDVSMDRAIRGMHAHGASSTHDRPSSALSIPVCIQSMHKRGRGAISRIENPCIFVIRQWGNGIDTTRLSHSFHTASR